MIAITGVTGQVGGSIAKQLSEAGVEARHLARNPQKAAKLPYATVYKVAYEDSPEVVEALIGVDTLFMVSAHEGPDRLPAHRAFIDAAVKAGVKHIVYTSFFAASPDATFTLAHDHAATEAYIKDKGLAYTFLRDNFYMDFFVNLCLDYGEIKGPAGQGKCSAVVRQDVAEVAATILQNPEQWRNQTLDMTGPASLSMVEIVQAMSQHLNKDIAYIPETVEEAYESRKQWEAEQWEYDSWVSTYTAIASGELAEVSNDIERVLGRPATDLASFLKQP